MLTLTGSTGRLGGRVAALVHRARPGAPLRLVVRDPSRAPELPGAEVVRGAYDDAGLADALAGTTTLLLVSGGESRDRVEQHRLAVDAAVAAGVGHVVYTSFLGAAPDATFLLARDHDATERMLRDSGLAWTFLRNGLYAQDLPHLATDGVLRGPAGDGRVSAVSLDDVAAATAAVLLDPGPHAGRTYALTGPQALTLEEVAAVLTARTGTAFSYVPEDLAQARASRAGLAEDWLVEAWISTYTAMAAGELDAITDHVLALTGRPATALVDVPG